MFVSYVSQKALQDRGGRGRLLYGEGRVAGAELTLHALERICLAWNLLEWKSAQLKLHVQETAMCLLALPVGLIQLTINWQESFRESLSGPGCPVHMFWRGWF